jgi:hypothetical protein
VTARKNDDTRRRTNQTKQWSSKLAMINCHSSGGRRASGGIARDEACSPTPGETSDSGLPAGIEVPLWGLSAGNARDELFHASGEASAVSWSRGRYCAAAVLGASSRSGVWRLHTTMSRRRPKAPGSGGQRVVFWDPALLRACRTQRRAIKRSVHRKHDNISAGNGARRRGN